MTSKSNFLCHSSDTVHPIWWKKKTGEPSIQVNATTRHLWLLPEPTWKMGSQGQLVDSHPTAFNVIQRDWGVRVGGCMYTCTCACLMMCIVRIDLLSVVNRLRLYCWWHELQTDPSPYMITFSIKLYFVMIHLSSRDKEGKIMWGKAFYQLATTMCKRLIKVTEGHMGRRKKTYFLLKLK